MLGSVPLPELSRRRFRWRARYWLGPTPYALRSSIGRARVKQLRGWGECGFQIGATFHAFRGASSPYFLCCDSNIKVAIQGTHTGYSPAAVLTDRELDGIIRRETDVYAAAADIFTLSEHLRRSFIQDFGIPAGRVHCVHAGPNFDLGRLSVINRSLPTADAAPTILFVGTEFARKGGDVLLRAFRRVREEVPDARLLVISGERGLPTMGGVEILGHLDKDSAAGWEAFLGAYQRAHVFCLPTRFEPFGIAFVEAMHFGLPCVGTATDAVPEIVADGETGYLVPVDDEAALTS
jgi:starch synthase